MCAVGDITAGVAEDDSSASTAETAAAYSPKARERAREASVGRLAVSEAAAASFRRSRRIRVAHAVEADAERRQIRCHQRDLLRDRDASLSVSLSSSARRWVAASGAGISRSRRLSSSIVFAEVVSGRCSEDRVNGSMRVRPSTALMSSRLAADTSSRAGVSSF